jgi:hypothetical protein
MGILRRQTRSLLRVLIDDIEAFPASVKPLWRQGRWRVFLLHRFVVR